MFSIASIAKQIKDFTAAKDYISPAPIAFLDLSSDVNLVFVWQAMFVSGV